jgi:hypothetical protein
LEKVAFKFKNRRGLCEFSKVFGTDYAALSQSFEGYITYGLRAGGKVSKLTYLLKA